MAKKLLERLRRRADVYVKSESRTEFGELTYDYEKISSVWAEIKPISAKENVVDGNSIQTAADYKIVVRNGAIKEPRNDMYFIFKGQKYEVKYFCPFNYKCVVEFYCKLIIETEEDYKNGEK